MSEPQPFEPKLPEGTQRIPAGEPIQCNDMMYVGGKWVVFNVPPAQLRATESPIYARPVPAK